MRVLICGDRNWTDRTLIFREVGLLAEIYGKALEGIHGGARGADVIGGDAFIAYGVTPRVFKAEWSTYGRAAGPIRNQQMLDAKPDLVLAFHDNLETSRGTKNLLALARQRGLPVRVISHETV